MAFTCIIPTDSSSSNSTTKKTANREREGRRSEEEEEEEVGRYIAVRMSWRWVMMQRWRGARGTLELAGPLAIGRLFSCKPLLPHSLSLSPLFPSLARARKDCPYNTHTRRRVVYICCRSRRENCYFSRVPAWFLQL